MADLVQTHSVGGGAEVEVLTSQPPTYDAPETTGLFDTKTRVLFSADSFGGLFEDRVDRADEPSKEALDTLLANVSEARKAKPFIGPNQEELAKMPKQPAEHGGAAPATDARQR
jgi:hypothetical protein